MSKYIDTERLISYLGNVVAKEFKKTEEKANSPIFCHFHSGCRKQALDTIDFIKSLQQEQSEIDLEEEVKKYFQGYWPGTKTPEQCNTDMHFTPLAITRMVKHFYELGKNAKKI